MIATELNGVEYVTLKDYNDLLLRADNDRFKIEAVISWIEQLVDGREVSDFALSFGIVRDVWEVREIANQHTEVAIELTDAIEAVLSQVQQARIQIAKEIWDTDNSDEFARGLERALEILGEKMGDR